MPHSILGYRTVPADSESAGTIITLHGNNQSSDAMLPLAKEVANGRRIEAPEAARGIYQFRTRTKSTWYGGYDIHQPEPTSFADSLAQIERFIYDAMDRSGHGAPRPWLIGYEQGAVLASTMAMIAPDLLSGVIALGGGLPELHTDLLPDPLQGEIPIQLIADSNDDAVKSRIEASATRLTELGNRVTVEWKPVSIEPGSSVFLNMREMLVDFALA